MKDMISRALSMEEIGGATYADIRIVSRDAQNVAMKNGQLETLQQDRTQGFGVSCTTPD